MKRLVVALIFSLIGTASASAYISGIAIQTDRTSSMSVFVNGKLYNKQPGKFVRIKSLPGLFHVEVRVLNPYDKTWYLLKKDITAVRGYELYYRVVFAKNKRPTIQQVKKYPVYTKYFVNPALYNRNTIS